MHKRQAHRAQTMIRKADLSMEQMMDIRRMARAWVEKLEQRGVTREEALAQVEQMIDEAAE